MITKNECVSMLLNLETKGISVDNYIRKTLTSKTIPIDVLKFINDNQGIEATKFYEMLRKNHNLKKSPLYTNILRDNKTEEDLITTLTSLIQQISLYSSKLDKKERALFLKEIRAEEASRVLHLYFKDGDYEHCNELLKAIKCDLLVLEGISGRRDFE